MPTASQGTGWAVGHRTERPENRKERPENRKKRAGHRTERAELPSERAALLRAFSFLRSARRQTPEELGQVPDEFAGMPWKCGEHRSELRREEGADREWDEPPLESAESLSVESAWVRSPSPVQTYSPERRFSVGDRLTHPKFGGRASRARSGAVLGGA
jgi:hypothetical protein